ncbi:MAG: peptide ABC transporter substrate-binding protein [Chloroflexi bacterium]|nr:peptide ABC transporter substrate-binding protein [Chloroflexota bacterium]
MKKLRWQLIIIFLTGLVVGILLLSEQPEPASVFVPEPVQGGIYTEGMVGTLQRLNPVLDFYNPVDRDINRLIYSSLIKFDSAGNPQPDLAAAWGYAQDGTIYNFELYPDIKWHDGQPLTAQDVVFTVDLLRNGDPVVPADVQAFWKEIEVVALSDTTLQFRLPEPFAPFLDYLTFGVLPNHLLAGKTIADLIDDPFNLQPVGSGPYQFDRLLVENSVISGVVLNMNSAYYRQPAYIEQIVIRFYPDAPSALDAYRAGEVQGISEVTAEILPDVLAEPNLALYSGKTPDLMLVFLNLNNPEAAFLQEKEVRQALMSGINRQLIIDTIMGSQGVLVDAPLMPNTWAYSDALPPREYEPETATLLLKEAGYVITGEESVVRQKEGTALSIDLIFPDEDPYYAIAEQIQKDWLAIGVETNLTPLGYEELVNDRLENRNYEAALVKLSLRGSADPDPYPFWDQAQATGGQNYSQWDNRLASEYLEAARITPDLQERTRLYHNFQVLFQEEVPSIPLFYPVASSAVDYKVQGVRVGTLFEGSDRYNLINEWFLVANPASRRAATPAAE